MGDPVDEPRGPIEVRVIEHYDVHISGGTVSEHILTAGNLIKERAARGHVVVGASFAPDYEGALRLRFKIEEGK